MSKKFLVLSLTVLMLLSGCSVSSVDDYYSSSDGTGDNAVTISISCETAVNYSDCDRENAEILSDFVIYAYDGDTVFDVLKSACKQNEIQFEYEGSEDSVYIEGIDYLYQFDCGDLSGWQYCVNGEFPSVGCNSYEVNDGDTVQWMYTCDLGEDIGNKYSGD